MTLRMKVVLLTMGLLVCLNAFGQAATPAPTATPDPAAAPAPTAAAPPAAETAPATPPAPAPPPVTKPNLPKTGGGDIIVLKSGKILKDLKIIGRNPSDITVRITSGVTMNISRKQIAEIKENVADSTPGAAEDASPPQNDLNPDVLQKLAAPLPEEPPIKYENKDVISILEDLSKLTGVTFVIDEAVRTIPQKERSISIQAKSGMNAMNLLLDEVLKKIKKLDVLFQGDKLLFTTKNRSTKAPSTDTPPATPGTPVTPDTAPAAGSPPPPPPAAAPAAPAANAAAATPAPARRRGPR